MLKMMVKSDFIIYENRERKNSDFIVVFNIKNTYLTNTNSKILYFMLFGKSTKYHNCV